MFQIKTYIEMLWSWASLAVMLFTACYWQYTHAVDVFGVSTPPAISTPYNNGGWNSPNPSPGGILFDDDRPAGYGAFLTSNPVLRL